MSTYEAYKKILKSKKQEETIKAKNDNVDSKEELNVWEKIGAGYQRIRDNIAQGFLDLGEGVVDFHAGLISAGAKVFGNAEAEAELNKFIKTDYTSRFLESDFYDKGTQFGLDFGFVFGEKANQLADSQEKFLPDIVENVSTGIGNALGSAALNAIPYVGPLVTGMAYTGSALEQPLSEGADTLEALGYGALSGATEMITEKVMGNILGKIGLGTGKFAGIGKGTGGATGSVVANIVKNANEEGLEEVVSEIVNPIWQMLTYKSETEGDFAEKYGTIFEENGGWDGVVNSYLSGALTGGLFEGVQVGSGIARYGSLEAYSLEQEAQQIADINQQMKEALASGNEARYTALQAKKDNILGKSSAKFEKFLEQLKVDTEAKGITKTTARKQQLAGAYIQEGTRNVNLDLAQEILGKDIKTILSKDKNTSETNVADAVVKFSEKQITFKQFIKTVLHEGVHLADGSTGEVVNRIIDGMSEQEYADKWAWAEKYYKNEVMQSNMLKREMERNPNLTKEQAYNRVKKTYFEEEMASEYFGEMFKNANDFMKSLKGYKAKGLSALKEKIRQHFRGKVKPRNYKEVMEAFDKGIAKAQERGKARAEKETKVETKKRITEDSEGNELSKQQQEFFKDTKFVDDEGNLLRLYHGTSYGGFMKFYETDNGIFLTPNYENAIGYAYSDNFVITTKFNSMEELLDYIYSENELDMNVDLLSGKEAIDDLNLTISKWEEQKAIATSTATKNLADNKIKYYNEIAESGYVGYVDGFAEFYYKNEKEALKLFMADLQEMVSYNDAQRIDEGYLEPEESKAKNLYALYGNAKKPLVINCRGNNFMNVPFRNQKMRTDDITSIIKTEGEYDGVIFKNIKDTGGRYREEFIDDVYVVFNSNQVKAIDNHEPTLNDDIRYRITEDEPLGQRFKDLLLKRLEKYKDNPKYNEILDKVNNATKSEFQPLQKEIAQLSSEKPKVETPKKTKPSTTPIVDRENIIETAIKNFKTSKGYWNFENNSSNVKKEISANKVLKATSITTLDKYINSINEEIKSIKESKPKIIKLLVDKGLTEKEAEGQFEDYLDEVLNTDDDNYRGLNVYLKALESKRAKIEETTKQANKNKVVEPTIIEPKQTQIVIQNNIEYVRTQVRKQPTTSAQAVNLYADFRNDPEAKVYAQERGNDLLQFILDNITEIYGLKNSQPRLFFKDNKEFAINKIHMILNKFSNAGAVKGGEGAFDYSKLTTQEQIDLITDIIINGTQVYTKVYKIDSNGQINAKENKEYVFIVDMKHDKLYPKIIDAIKKQISNIMEKGDTPKVVKLINEATAKLKNENQKLSNKVSDLSLRVKADNESIKELHNEIREYQNTIANLDTPDKANIKEIERLNKIIDQKNKAIEMIESRTRSRIKTLEMEKTTLKDEKVFYKQLLKETEREVKEANKTTDKTLKTLEKTQEKIDKEIAKREEAQRITKEAKELATLKAKQLERAKELQTKYANELIYNKSQLKRGVALDKKFTNVLTEIGKEINREFAISNQLSIRIAELLKENNVQNAFNLYVNAIYDSDIEIEDAIVPYSELADMFDTETSAEFYTAIDSLKETFENIISTGKLTQVERLYNRIERISSAYLDIKNQFQEKKRDMARYKVATQSVNTAKRVNKTFSKLKTKKKFGTDLESMPKIVEFLTNTYDKLSKLKVKDIENFEFVDSIKEIYAEYRALDITDKEFSLSEDVIKMLNAIENATPENYNRDLILTYKKMLNQFNRYAKEISGSTAYTIDGVTKTRAEWAEELYNEFEKNFPKGFNWNLINEVIDPRLVFKLIGNMDENSTIYKLYKMLNQGEIEYQRVWVQLSKPFREFEKKHKKWINQNLSSDTMLKKAPRITISELTGTKAEFLSLYKLLKREQSRNHILNSAGGIKLDGKTIRGFNEERLTEIENAIVKYFDLNNENSLYAQYIEMSTEFFSKAKSLKVKTDKRLMGYTNVEEGEYFPIRVIEEDMYRELGSKSFASDGIVGALDMSFNKDVVSSTKAIKIGNISEIMTNHLNQMAVYSAYAIPINTFQKLFNYRFSVKEKTLNSLHALVTSKQKSRIGSFNTYMNNLFLDMQGVPRKGKSIITGGLLGKLRGNFARFQLGANIKVIFTQVSALGNALKYVSVRNLGRAINETLITRKINIKEGKYALPTIGEYRNMSNEITKAQTLQDKANVFTKGIEWADQKAINIIWRACLLQNNMDVEKATQMFNRTVQETQPNYTPLQRSALMRSQDEFVKSFTMFGNQPNKNLTNFLESIFTISNKIKNKKSLDSNDMKFVYKTISSLVWSSAIYSAMSIFFTHLINGDWDDEPEDVVLDFAEKFLNDAIIGMVPIINNAINIDFQTGIKWYGVNFDNTFSIIDDLANLFQGTPNAKEISETLGLLFGIPMANIYKYFIKTPLNYIDRQMSAEVDTLYQGKSLTTTQAVKSAESYNTKYYYRIYTNNTIPMSNEIINELYRLYKIDNGVILKAIPKSITYNEETYKVDKSKFSNYYKKIEATIKNVINSMAYKKLTDEQKALVMKNIINKYFSTSKKMITGQDLSLMDIILTSNYNISKDLIYLAQINELETKEEKQKFINKLPLKAPQKYLLYHLAGYSLTDEKKTMVKGYLVRGGVPLKQIKELLD